MKIILKGISKGTTECLEQELRETKGKRIEQETT